MTPDVFRTLFPNARPSVSHPVIPSSVEAAEEYFCRGAQHFIDGKCEQLLYQNVAAYAAGWNTAREWGQHQHLEQAIARGDVRLEKKENPECKKS